LPLQTLAEYGSLLFQVRNIVASGSINDISISGSAGASIVQLKAEQESAPSDPGAGNGGYLYTKADGKVYWRSNDLGETDLTAGGTSVAGSDTQLQYNNGGAAGGASALSYSDSNGYLGIGVTGGDITHRLTLPSTANANGSIKAYSYETYSSQRYKENVNTLDNALEKISQLRGVTFDWISTGKKDFGFIAEEACKVIPEVVSLDSNNRPQSMDYARITSLLVEAVKQQQKQIDVLTKYIMKTEPDLFEKIK